MSLTSAAPSVAWIVRGPSAAMALLALMKFVMTETLSMMMSAQIVAPCPPVAMVSFSSMKNAMMETTLVLTNAPISAHTLNVVMA
jgi:hypothetical protein